MSGNPNYLAHGLVAVSCLFGVGFLSSSHFALDVALFLVVNRTKCPVPWSLTGSLAQSVRGLCLTWEMEQKRRRDALLLVAWPRMPTVPHPRLLFVCLFTLYPNLSPHPFSQAHLYKFLPTARSPSQRRRSPFWVPPSPGASHPNRTRYILSH